MSDTFERVKAPVAQGDWRASDHAPQRLIGHGIIAIDLEAGIAAGTVVEDYPTYHPGPCVLVLQFDSGGPVHALWGLEQGADRPAVLITTYRPDRARWNVDWRTRK